MKKWIVGPLLITGIAFLVDAFAQPGFQWTCIPGGLCVGAFCEVMQSLCGGSEGSTPL